MPNVGASALPVISDKTKIASVMVVDNANNPSLAAPGLVGGGSGGAGVATLVLTRDPTSADDGTAGYVVGQFAENTVTGRSFVARSVATGAAVWVPLAIGRSIGYIKDGTKAYYPEGMKINGSNPAAGIPSTAGRIYFTLGTIVERITVTNFLLKAATGASGVTAQVAVYKIDPATKRPIGPPLGNTADIDCSATGVKTAAPAAALVLEPGPYAFAFMTNTGSTGGTSFTLLDASDPTAYQNWGYSSTDIFGAVMGLIFAGTYGTWPNFASGATFSAGYSASPAIAIVPGAAS